MDADAPGRDLPPDSRILFLAARLDAKLPRYSDLSDAALCRVALALALQTLPPAYPPGEIETAAARRLLLVVRGF